ncbi:MAG: hypothetical protein ACI9HK_003754, partial [Pirellulaceae bacterium]
DYDASGSTIGISNEQGDLVEQYDYSINGELVSQAPNDSVLEQPFQYAGRGGRVSYHVSGSGSAGNASVTPDGTGSAPSNGRTNSPTTASPGRSSRPSAPVPAPTNGPVYDAPTVAPTDLQGRVADFFGIGDLYRKLQRRGELLKRVGDDRQTRAEEEALGNIDNETRDAVNKVAPDILEGILFGPIAGRFGLLEFFGKNVFCNHASDICFPPDGTPNRAPDDTGNVNMAQVPRDPNDIIGPDGFGDQNWINADNPLPYKIRFENDPDAGAEAPAKIVRVTQTLDNDLDFRSFRLGDIGFADIIIDVPDNQAYFQQRLDFTDDLGIFLDVLAGIDVKTGEVFWELTSIDPETGEVPRDETLGFLAVNDDNGIGEGFLNYTARPKRDAMTGVVIDAEARIVFDVNEPIDTPAIFNTLDVDDPTSSIAAIEASQVNGAEATLVRWFSRDDANGSGLHSTTVFVSENGGEFTRWLTDTTLAESIFIGDVNSQYSFYSIARDNAGNASTQPTTISTLNSPSIIDLRNSAGVFDVNLDGGVITASVNGFQLLQTQNPTIDVIAESDDQFESNQEWEFVNILVDNDEFFQVLQSGDAFLRITGYGWTNFLSRLDVDASGKIDPLDVLIVINELNRPRFSVDTGELFDPTTLEPFPNVFYDVSQDQIISPLDALIIINYLNRQDSANAAVGESIQPLAKNFTPALRDETVDSKWNPSSASEQTLVDAALTETNLTWLPVANYRRLRAELWLGRSKRSDTENGLLVEHESDPLAGEELDILVELIPATRFVH